MSAGGGGAREHGLCSTERLRFVYYRLPTLILCVVLILADVLASGSTCASAACSTSTLRVHRRSGRITAGGGVERGGAGGERRAGGWYRTNGAPKVRRPCLGLRGANVLRGGGYEMNDDGEGAWEAWEVVRYIS